MHHALVQWRYPEHVAAAQRLSLEEALDQFLLAYLPQALYANPPLLAKDLKLPLTTVSIALERLEAKHIVIRFPLAKNTTGYLWCE